MDLNRRFEVPFNNDFDTYEEKVLKPFGNYIQSVYFAAPVYVASNARPYKEQFDLDKLFAFTKTLANKYNIKPLLVLNGSWSPMTIYTDHWMSQLMSFLTDMRKKGLYGIILQNNYLMSSKVFQRYLPDLRITSSVNQGIDTLEKADNLIDILGYKSIVWDRNMNLHIENLIESNKALKEKYTDVETKILLNEGCLPYCPFKREHDNLIGMLSYVDNELNDYNKAIFEKYPALNGTMNRINFMFGCQKLYQERPELVLKSPYILPENLVKFDEAGDIFKIGGRTQATDWIAKVLNAYITGEKTGELLYFLDCSKHIVKKVEEESTNE